jgi:DNA-binding LacI/PurR family transcriptional regulator
MYSFVMSIARVAQAANVSYATAWRIINNQPCGSEEAIAAVRRAMGVLGYEPGATRRGRGRRPRLADGIRTRNIALLHFRPSSSISTSVLNCVHQMLAERNLNLIFAHCEKVELLPQAVKSGNIDGILGYGQFPAEAVTPALRKIPAVWMMSRTDPGADPWGDRVKPDHAAIGQIAAEYLVGRGHRCLAYLNPDVDFPLYQHRSASFRSGAELAGMPPQIYSSRGTDDLNTEAERLVEQWIAASPRPTGIFVPVDRVTLFIYRHLERRGIQPGRDVDIVSCDNERELLSLMRPAPASIDLNRDMIARLAVERLLWRMKNGVSSPSVVVTVSPTLLEQDHAPGGGSARASADDDGDGNGDGALTRKLPPANGSP